MSINGLLDILIDVDNISYRKLSWVAALYFEVWWRVRGYILLVNVIYPLGFWFRFYLVFFTSLLSHSWIYALCLRTLDFGKGELVGYRNV